MDTHFKKPTKVIQLISERSKQSGLIDWTSNPRGTMSFKRKHEKRLVNTSRTKCKFYFKIDFRESCYLLMPWFQLPEAFPNVPVMSKALRILRKAGFQLWAGKPPEKISIEVNPCKCVSCLHTWICNPSFLCIRSSYRRAGHRAALRCPIIDTVTCGKLRKAGSRSEEWPRKVSSHRCFNGCSQN